MQLRGLCGRVAVTTLASSDPVSPELRSAYDAQKLVPLWESGTTGFSQGGEQPRHWPWEAIGPILRETAHITVPSIVERRVLMMMNPTIPRNDAESCAGLVSAGVQALMPGEIARPHRHAMHALRFVLEGEGAETIVEGKACAMEPGDLVVTPGWAWHAHHNKGGKPTLWVDILDLAIHRAMRTDMFQPGPVNALRAVPADRAYGAAGIVPVGIEENEVARAGHTMMFRYPAGPAQAAAANAPQDQFGIRLARYVDPRNGGAIVPTIDCYLMQLEEAETAKARSLGAQLCVVVAGAGESDIDGTRIAWRRHDVFTIPRGATVVHRISEGPAQIFVASDIEIYRRLGQAGGNDPALFAAV